MENVGTYEDLSESLIIGGTQERGRSGGSEECGRKDDGSTMVGGSAIKFVLEKVDSLIQKELQLQREGHVTSIRGMGNLLQRLKVFLVYADEEENSDVAQRPLANQVRKIADDIEDVLEVARDHFGRQPQGCGVVGCLHKGALSIKQCPARRRIGTRIKQIKAEIDNLSTFTPAMLMPIRGRLHDRHVEAPFTSEADIVGIARPREELVKRLLKREETLKVITVFGMGGVGKTTLARQVYDDRRVKEHFNCHAWIPVRRSFTTEELLRSIIYRLFEEKNKPLPRRIDIMEIDQLSEAVRRYLGKKKYIVVFYGVWDIRVWNYIRYALPLDNGDNCGSRVVVTTRIFNVAEEASGQINERIYDGAQEVAGQINEQTNLFSDSRGFLRNTASSFITSTRCLSSISSLFSCVCVSFLSYIVYWFINPSRLQRQEFSDPVSEQISVGAREASSRIYNLQPLPKNEALLLLYKKAFGSVRQGACPVHLEQVCEDIVSQCAGLPLAIVTIGGLLQRKTLLTLMNGLDFAIISMQS